ncbi:MAG: hypothetical protein SNJ77_06430 [Cytophagales bacterium]
MDIFFHTSTKLSASEQRQISQGKYTILKREIVPTDEKENEMNKLIKTQTKNIEILKKSGLVLIATLLPSQTKKRNKNIKF